MVTRLPQLLFRLFLPALFCLLPVASFAAAPSLKLNSAASSVALAPGESVTIHILVTIEAPPAVRADDRPPLSVSLVIDRSGSMEEARKLSYAIQAGKTLVRALDGRDTFGLVAYDSNIYELAPLSPLRDKEKIIKILDRLTPGSMTNLSGGLEAGIKQLRADTSENPRRLILLSDGLANRGVTNSELVAAIGAKARADGITASTVGLGLDYDETMMELLAQRGGGQYYYVKDSEDLPAVFRQELALAAEMVTRDMLVTLTPSGAAKDLKVYGYSTQQDGENRRIEMADLYAGEKRQIMLRATLTPEAGEKDLKLGEIRIAYADTTDGEAHEAVQPLTLTVEADKDAREARNAEAKESITLVREEGLLLDAEEAHVAAMEALAKGQKEDARKLLAENRARLAPAAPANKAIANKMEAMAEAESNLDAAAMSAPLQQSMIKSAKSSAYQSAKGAKQGFMLQKGDKGFMVEKLQNALAAAGFYKGTISGRYDAAVEDAVKDFQKARSLDIDGIAGQATQSALGM